MKITIDSEKCIGCGVCTNACPEGIEIVNDKAVVKNNKANCFKEAVEICPIKIISIN